MPVEDYTTYTEVDPNNHIFLVGTNHIDATLTREEDAYLYKDRGVDHFQDFAHLVDARSPAYISPFGTVLVWGVSNVVDDAYAWTWGFTVELYAFSSLNYDVRLRTKGGTGGWGSAGVASSTKFSYGTWVYLKIIRSGTSLKCEIYSNAARTNLLETLEVTVGATEAYRYIYACSSWNTGIINTQEVDIENLDLQEAPPVVAPAPTKLYLTLTL